MLLREGERAQYPVGRFDCYCFLGLSLLEVYAVLPSAYVLWNLPLLLRNHIF